MRISKVIAGIVAALAVVAIIDGAVTAALQVYGTVSQVTWTQYSQQEEMDTLAVGTSFMQNAINPAILDEEVGCVSFNMGSPDQTLQESLIGIRTAYEDYGIKRVIVNVSSFEKGEDDEVNLNDEFLRQRAAVVSPDRAAAAWWDLAVHKGGLSTESSINVVFPWAKNHVALTPSRIMSNLRMRLEGVDIMEAAQIGDPERTFHEAGYSSVTTVTDYNSGDVKPYYAQVDDEWEPAVDKAASLREICEYCADHDIELFVVGTPMPPFVVLNYGTDGEHYFAMQQAIQDVLNDYGLTYYDFSMARPEVFPLLHEYYYGIAHLNEEGAKEFTRAFGTFLRDYEAGGDVSALFYSRDEYLASIDYIDALLVEAVATEEGVTMTGDALAGPAVDVEYRFSVQDELGAWQVVRDYAAEPSFTYKPASRGVVNYKIEVREQGSSADYEYFRDANVLY